jgi:neutral ceramidase
MNWSIPARRLALLAALSLCLAQANARAGNVRAGVARVNLTPPLEMKAALGGYGARMSKPALGEHDSVLAKALVLAQDERKFVLVTADVLAFPPGFKAAVMDRLAGSGLSPDQVMLLASHSHTSIDMMAIHPGNQFGIPQVGVFQKALFEFIAGKLAKCIQEADRHLVSVSAGSTTIAVPERNRNRRPSVGIHDTALTVTRIDAVSARPVAVLVNWTAHPTFMDAEDMMFSGDWPGHLQRTIEALIGQDTSVMFYNGAEGDQSPVPPDCASHWERAERYGREMGVAAWRAWEGIQTRDVTIFDFHTEAIMLPKQQAHPDFMKTGGAEYGLDESMMKGFLEHLVPAQTHSTSLRLGDLVILGVPGEMAAQLGLKAKAEVTQITGATSVTIGGLADEWVSYILPAEEYRKGGYEASMSFYGETLGNTVVEGVVRGARTLK